MPRRIWCLATVVVLGALLGGCSSQPAEKPSPNHPVSESEKVHQQEQQMDQANQPPAPEPTNQSTTGGD